MALILCSLDMISQHIVAACLDDSSSCILDENTVEWELPSLLKPAQKGWTILGKPKIVDCPYGKAVEFDGQDDALLFDSNPLANLRSFTIEVIVRPNSNGPREQRFLHFGEVRGERVLLETRLTKENSWYLDTYLKSGQTGLTLADTSSLHPLNRWYHIAFTVDDGSVEVFIDGEKELQGQVQFSPLSAGKSSVGVRLNRVNWFKGAMYKIKITSKKLRPDAFLKH